MTHSTKPQPFDERSALEELEQLAAKIQRSRRQREQTVAEFDTFVRKLREERYTASIAATRTEERRVADRPALASAGTRVAQIDIPEASASAPSLQPINGLPTARFEGALPTAVAPDALVEAFPVAEPTRPRAAFVAVAVAALAVVVVAVLLWRSSTSEVAPDAQTVTPTAAGASPAPEVLRTPPPAPPPVPARPVNVELITLRPVWARVTVDDRRAVERELTADTRLTFGADRAIAIRAGDAGAIRLIVDGKDLGVLGPDGQIFSRVFAPPPR